MIGRTLAIAGACAVLGGCSKPETATHEISESRPFTDEDAALVSVNSAAERFGLKRAADPVVPAAGGVSEGEDNPFQWIAPPGWVEVEGSRMRAVNFKLGASSEGECYLVALPGGAGGTAANVNRWRKQMGQADFTEEEIAALPEMTFFGSGATRVDISGDFAGMGAAGAKKGYRMLGAIKATDQFTLFVKMTGPADLVGANEEAFDEFCASVGIKATPKGDE